MAADLLDEEWEMLLAANQGDLARAESSGMTASAQDRLRLTEGRVRAMASRSAQCGRPGRSRR